MKKQDAIVFEKLNNIANQLDDIGMWEEASEIDDVMIKNAGLLSGIFGLGKWLITTAIGRKILLLLAGITYGLAPEMRYWLEEVTVGRDAAAKKFMEKLQKPYGFLNQSAVRGILENATLSDPEIARVHQYLVSRFKAADADIKQNNVTGFLEKRRAYAKYLPSLDEMAILPEKIEAVSNDLNTREYDDKTKQKYLNYIFEKTDKKKFVDLDSNDSEAVNNFVDDSIRKKVREPISKSDQTKLDEEANKKVELATPEQEERLIEQIVTLGYDYNNAAGNIDNLVLLARLLAYKGVNIKDRDDIVSRFMNDKKFKSYKSQDIQNILASEFSIGSDNVAQKSEGNIQRSVPISDSGYSGKSSSKIKLDNLNIVKDKIGAMVSGGTVDSNYLKRVSNYLNYPSTDSWDLDKASSFIGWIDNQIATLTTGVGTQVDIDSEPTQQADYNYTTREYETKPVEESSKNILRNAIPDSSTQPVKQPKQRWTAEQQSKISSTISHLEGLIQRIQNGGSITSDESTRLKQFADQVQPGLGSSIYTWDEGVVKRILEEYKAKVNG